MENECGAAFACVKVGKRKIEEDYFSFCKRAQASPSSGVFHIFAREDWLIKAVCMLNAERCRVMSESGRISNRSSKARITTF